MVGTAEGASGARSQQLAEGRQGCSLATSVWFACLPLDYRPAVSRALDRRRRCRKSLVCRVLLIMFLLMPLRCCSSSDDKRSFTAHELNCSDLNKSTHLLQPRTVHAAHVILTYLVLYACRHSELGRIVRHLRFAK